MMQAVQATRLSASNLTWLDHDPAARERSLRILALFQERDSRDELGLGAIRDSFSDQLFPGTSTIQTRLRYMLFVPWVYRELERKRAPSSSFAARARQLELSLTAPLLESDDRAGVFGISAGKALKRLPSEAYWSGLGTWGIRRFEGSRDEYHQAVDQVYALRSRRREHVEDDEARLDATITWHPKLPEPPDGFPQGLDFVLTEEEADFLRDCIVTGCGKSLLAWLAREGKPGVAETPWAHPDFGSFPDEHRKLVEQARVFSHVMHGAARLYNLTLAELDGRTELAEEHREGMRAWAEGLDRAALGKWSPDRFGELISDPSHRVTFAARRFVERWFDLAAERPGALADDPDARYLVERRERKLKGPRSRYVNARLREQWGGRAGLRPMLFRWETARRFLDDLHRGLQGH